MTYNRPKKSKLKDESLIVGTQEEIPTEVLLEVEKERNRSYEELNARMKRSEQILDLIRTVESEKQGMNKEFAAEDVETIDPERYPQSMRETIFKNHTLKRQR